MSSAIATGRRETMRERSEPAPRGAVSDTELLAALRGGDLSAYEELWCRHHRAAMTFGLQLSRNHAEDLVSESFTAVLQTVTVSGKGPTDGFRAYLFASMRNAAAKLARENSAINIDDPERLPVFIVQDDKPDPQQQEDARAIIRAFRAVPERWQTALWLAEVEDAPRARIADELGLKPNAVSALLRRARQGLRLEWLAQLVPDALRGDPEHVADLLPKEIAGSLPGRKRGQVRAHLDTCSVCAETHLDLNDAWQRLGNKSLGSLGFGALGAVLFEGGISPLAGGAAAAAVSAAAAGASVLPTAASAGFGLKLVAVMAAVTLAAQVAVIGALVFKNIDSAAQAMTATSPRPEQVEPGTGGFPNLPTAGTPPEDERADSPTESPAGAPQAPVSTLAPLPTASGGRYSGDDWVPYLDLDSAVSSQYQPATPPTPSSPSLPPGEDSPSETPGGLPPVALATAFSPIEWIAPVLEGTANPGATVGIEVDEASGASGTRTYSVAADSSGTWAFDLSAVPLSGDLVDLNVWQVEGDQASAPVSASFVLYGAGVTLLSHVSIPAFDAAVDGLPVDFNGPAGGTVCLVTDTDQRFDIPLAADGTARRFVRFVGDGDFDLRFLTCDGDRFGPAHHSVVSVVPEGMPGFGGFSLEPDARRVLVDTE